ncbi:unnamed protein product [Darwinula stevensoni]|uniref:ABC transporter domain-containing protein n=1 Tax=Darwinula stevensoni TaxID=69355 RepID=A0A7R8X7V2_9CRUS|nr:unnamed protein product [Darwinula stevensoni]CAG0883753.1 unnamed protein product [Darwinula stevensoni]
MATRVAVQPRLRDAVAQTLNRGAEAEAVLIENIRSAHSIKLLSNEAARSNMWANAFTQQLQAYKNMFGASFVKIVHLWIERKVLQVHLDRVADIVETDTEDPDFSKPIDDVNNLTGAVSVKNLTYIPRGADREILKDINLHIRAGEKMAIVGRTGSGKTTLLNLISGLYKAPDGHVFADNADLARVNVRQYRKNLAAVTQSDQLFRGTIMANITNFSPTAKKSLMIEVAKMVEIHDEIQQLDQAYQTNIGDTQKFLSAGQMQRLLIARALYIQPKILILDEFTSNLDRKTALEICKAVMKLPCTCIIVTHADYVLSMVDSIYKMEDGRLEKVGQDYLEEIAALARVGMEKQQ